jgi:antitoxin component YwqK of YwqJK toxin-antitoxin module
LPAVELANGGREWYQNGKLHRDGDLPAVELANGGREWYQEGKRYRNGDGSKPTKIYYKDGVKNGIYYENGRYLETKEMPI